MTEGDPWDGSNYGAFTRILAMARPAVLTSALKHTNRLVIMRPPWFEDRPTISNRAPEGPDHYSWGDGCEGWHLLRTEDLSVVRERMPPATSESLHRHWRAHQFFFIVAGTAMMVVEGVRSEIVAGRGIDIAPGRAHRIENQSESVLEFLVISQPPIFGDRIECVDETTDS